MTTAPKPGGTVATGRVYVGAMEVAIAPPDPVRVARAAPEYPTAASRQGTGLEEDGGGLARGTK
jgi:hypothetical protein